MRLKPLILALALTSCYAPESLLNCNYSDRVVTGYNRDRTKYKVVNACNGLKEPNVKIEGDTVPIGGVLICRYRNENRY